MFRVSDHTLPPSCAVFMCMHAPCTCKYFGVLLCGVFNSNLYSFAFEYLFPVVVGIDVLFYDVRDMV